MKRDFFCKKFKKYPIFVYFLNLMKTLYFTYLAAFFMLITSCDSDKNLVINKTWQVVGLKENQDALMKIPEIRYPFIFDDKNNLSISLDINSCGSSVKFGKNNQLKVDGFGCSEACCDSEMAVKMITDLVGNNTYSHSGNKLSITTGIGSIIFLESKD